MIEGGVFQRVHDELIELKVGEATILSCENLFCSYSHPDAVPSPKSRGCVLHNYTSIVRKHTGRLFRAKHLEPGLFWIERVRRCDSMMLYNGREIRCLRPESHSRLHKNWENSKKTGPPIVWRHGMVLSQAVRNLR